MLVRHHTAPAIDVHSQTCGQQTALAQLLTAPECVVWVNMLLLPWNAAATDQLTNFRMRMLVKGNRLPLYVVRENRCFE